jgi:acetyl esterase/lipase
LVLWLHGGAWAVGDPRGGAFAGQDWPKYLADLASRGYVVAGVSYRLVGEARYPAQIQDVRTAIRWLRSHAPEYGIDPSQVLIMGASAGGYLATLAGVSCGDASLDPPSRNFPGAPPPSPPPPSSECVQAVVAFYPVVDLPTLSRFPARMGPPNDSAEGAIGQLLGCAMAQCSPATLQAAGTLERIDAKDPPFLILHGDADTLVPLEQSRMLDKALKAKGVDSELIVVPGANHIFPNMSAEASRNLLDRVGRFLDQHSKH